MINNRAIIGHYQKRYFDLFGVQPKVNGAICGKMIKNLSADYSEETVLRVVDLFFDDPQNAKKSYHLPTILGTWSMNTYLPKTIDNPLLF